MARNYIFYFTVALLMISVYLAQSPKVKIAAARDMPMTINELKSILTGDNLMGGCGGYCRRSSDCYSRSCPYCYYDVIKHIYSCH
ncbi:hypothetical protein HAX54_011742 [Datura stramonium]|uniref:Uncharacterized protein n=1 Tax=Datura stramonium TaxID=4076 RepID=A0ABS8TKE0_DATST|nr:hypothetical protein [Datura stramonium]